MTFVEIVVIVGVAIFLLSVIGGSIYRKKKHPKKCNGNCNSCSGCDTYSSLIERYRNDYPKK